MEINEVEVNGVKYIRKDAVMPGLPQVTADMVIVRCKSAGVFFGKINFSDLPNGIVRLENARRLWFWSGAASLSQLAVDGTSKPGECRFPVPVTEITLTECIEVIPTTEKAAKSINKVPVWKA